MPLHVATRAVQRAAEDIAQVLWPGLTLTKDRELDVRGMAISKKLCREVWEKTRGQPHQPWRASPHAAKEWIFVTYGFAIRTTCDALAEAERGLPLLNLIPSSMFFLVPITKLYSYEEIAHDLWPWKPGHTPTKGDLCLYA